MSDLDYLNLLTYVQKAHPGTRNNADLPHPANALVLRRWAIPKNFLNISKDLRVSCTKPHNCVNYEVEGKVNYGIVTQIYEFQNPLNEVEWVLKIIPVHNKYPKDLAASTKFFRKLCYLLKVVVGQLESDTVLLSPTLITSVGAYRKLPPDTFNIPSNGIIVRPVDYDSTLSVL